MKKLLFCLLFGILPLTSCHESFDFKEANKQKIALNAQKVFGVEFDKNHDWCTTSSGEITINSIPSDVERVSILVHMLEEDGETSIFVLNEAETNGNNSVKLVYDAPANNLGLYIAFISKTNISVKKINSAERARTRSGEVEQVYPIPTVTPTIGVIEDSYANIRGWIPEEKLYQMSDYSSYKMELEDYSDESKIAFRTIIFSYFKNGRNYDNLPLVIESGLYNENSYPITTGNKPIVVTPIYKRDGATQYGNEVYNSDLYYYYFKEENVGSDPKAYFESLPKYKAIPFNECFAENEDDIIGKRGSYVLIYWGNETPTLGTEGSYQFPEGYKIGFMVRAKTTFENGKKQGELYSDGRLNNYINKYSACNFKSSKFNTDGPRGAWITVNGRMLLCFESGTDRDFNDIIIDVEGGIKPIINIPEFENNFYTFCFEDTELGDYDMNDVVIKARRISETQVEYSVVACGGLDMIKIFGINGEVINNDTEVHKMFNMDGGFINTLKGQNIDPIVEVVNVSKDFSFLDENTQPYILDLNTNKITRLSKTGEDPHGIMIPYDFKYPLEKVCIKNAYSRFNEWGQNKVVSTDWYVYPNEGSVW